MHNYLSPDNIAISFEWFNSKDEADLFLTQWVKKFENQGYYSSSNFGRISLENLKEHCRYIQLENDITTDQEEEIIKPF